MADKPKLLLLTPRFPYPLLAGDTLRIHHIASHLQSFYSITLVSFYDGENYAPEALPYDRIITLRISGWERVFNMLLGVFLLRPLQVSYYRSKKMARILSELEAEYSVVLMHLIRMVQYSEFVPGGRKVVELTDYLPITYKRSVWTGAGSFKWFLYLYEHFVLVRYHTKACASCDLVSFVSEEDAFAFSEHCSVDSIVSGNGIDLGSRPYSPRKSGGLLFVGNMRTLQNQHALEYFLDNIFPDILEELPATLLKVVGNVSESYRRKMARPGLVFVGVVESIADETRDCAVGICPVKIAAGVQNKVLEYAALGMACVTTTEGLEGLAFKPNEEIFVACSDNEFARHCLKLLRNDELRMGVAKMARVKCEKTYSWSGALNALSHELMPFDYSTDGPQGRSAVSKKKLQGDLQ